MKNLDKLRPKKRLFVIFWILCIIGSLSVLPYIGYLGLIPSSIPFAKFLLFAIILATLFFGVICWLSYLLVPRTDLFPFSTDQPLKRIVCPGVIAGAIVGSTIFFLDRMIFQNSLLYEGIHPPFWAGLLGSIYGAINEEILLRLFLFTFIYFLFKKIFKFNVRNRLCFLWITNIIVAIVFGIGHLPAAFKLAPPSSFEISRILLLNGIPGIVFGWMYWTRGIWTAMTAHFMADLMIHVFL